MLRWPDSTCLLHTILGVQKRRACFASYHHGTQVEQLSYFQDHVYQLICSYVQVLQVCQRCVWATGRGVQLLGLHCNMYGTMQAYNILIKATKMTFTQVSQDRTSHSVSVFVNVIFA